MIAQMPKIEVVRNIGKVRKHSKGRRKVILPINLEEEGSVSSGEISKGDFMKSEITHRRPGGFEKLLVRRYDLHETGH